MRRLLLVSLLLVGACAPSPLSAKVGTGALGTMESRVKAHGEAPNTRQTNGAAASLLSTPHASTTTGRPETFGPYTMTIPLDDGPLEIQARMIAPDTIKTVPQRYNNDCAQAALATTLGFLNVNFSGLDPYEAIAKAMPPMAWGTRMEDVDAFVNRLGVVADTPVRAADIRYLDSLVAEGKPVPVVLSLSASTMHYVVYIGSGISQANQRIVFFKDPSNPDPTNVGALDADTFVAAWQNQPLRGSWWSFFATGLTNTNPDNYERIAFDIGVKTR